MKNLHKVEVIQACFDITGAIENPRDKPDLNCDHTGAMLLSAGFPWNMQFYR